MEKMLREYALRNIYRIALMKAEELVGYLPKDMGLTLVTLSLLLARVLAVATRGKSRAKREQMTDGIVDFIREQMKG